MHYKINRYSIYYYLAILLIITTAWQWGQAVVIYGKAHLAQWLITSAWQQTLDSGESIKPWPWADTWPVAKIQFGSLSENKNNYSFYVLAGSTGNSLAFGPGHASDTALPATQGASVIGGHRDTHFSLLKDIKNNDKILIQNMNGEWKQYSVDQSWIANINTQPLYINKAKNDLYLVTCYPFNGITPNGSERYIVKAALKEKP